jgi:hypothetical protein
MFGRPAADAITEMRGIRSSRSRTAGLVLIVVGALTLSMATGIAVAQGPADSRPAPVAQASSGGDSSDSSGLRSNLGELPFTGLDLLILGGLSMVLLGTGMALRRLSAPRVFRS